MAQPCKSDVLPNDGADNETGSGSESCQTTSRDNTTEEITGKTEKEKVEDRDVQSDRPAARPRTIGRQLSEKELEITYKLLGVHRCSNCKFTTNEKDIFSAHETFCSKTRKPDEASSVSTAPQPAATQPTTHGSTPTPTHEAEQSTVQDESSGRKDQQLIEYTYTDEELFKCVPCNLTWNDKAQFVEHIVCHLSDSPYICITCKRNFESRAAIDIHIKQVHTGGSAKCGLMGIKKGRLVLEQLMEKKTFKILGKLNVPETPRSESIRSGKSSSELARETMTVKKDVASSEAQELRFSMPVISSVRSLATDQEQSSTPALNTSSKNGSKDMDNSTEPMPSVAKNDITDKPETVTSIQASGFILSKPSIDKDKQKHIDSLYGEFNPTSNSIIPTTISSKIQSIVNVSQSTTTGKAEFPKYVVKSLTQYLPEGTPTSTDAVVKQVGQAVSESNIKETPRVKSQGHPLLLIPVGPPIKTKQISPSVQWFPNKSSTTWLISPTISTPVISSPTVTYTTTNNNTLNAGSRVTLQSTPVQTVMPTSFTDNSMNESVSVPKVVSAPKIVSVTTPTTVNTESDKPKLTNTVKKSVVAANKTNRSCSKVFFVRPGYGFTCEVCRKFTKDENIFYKHIWDHLHGTPRACSICSDDRNKKMPSSCPLVCSVLFNIKKDQQGQGSNSNIKLFYDGKKEIIEITDDDVNTNQPIPEVIVLDEDDDNYDDDQQDKNKAEIVITDNSKKNNVEVSSDASSKEIIESEKDDNSHDGEERILESESQNDEHQETNEPEQVKQGNDSSDTTGKQHQGQIKSDNVARENVAREYNFTEDILSQSLSQTEETESFISQVIKSTLNDFYPNNGDQSLDSNVLVSSIASKENQPTVGASRKDNSEDLKKIKEFDTLLTSKHGPETFYLCGYEKCGFVCLSSNEYRTHLKIDKHKDEYCYICGHCGQKDYAEDNHVRHMFAHSNVKKFALCKCPVTLCKYNTNQIHLFKAHLEAHNTEDITIKCTYCHTAFPSASCLVEHLKKNLLKFVCCPYCTFKLTNKNLVREHIKLVHKDRIRMIGVSSQIVCYEREINFYVLPKSKKGSDDTGQLNTSALSDTEGLDIPKLVKSFAKDKTSAKNEGSNGNDELDTNETEAETDVNKNRQQDNVEEEETTASFKHLPILDSIGPKSFQCCHCNYVSYNQSFHEQHESIHNISPERDKQYLCMICPKGHDTLSSFKLHLAYHSGVQTINIYQCTLCAFRTNIKTHIMDHCADGHTEKSMFTLRKEQIDSKVVSCQHCGFKSRLQENLALHTYHVHKIKPVISVEPLQKETVLSRLDKTSTIANTSVKTSDPKANVASKIPVEMGEDKAHNKSSNKKYKYHCEYCKDKFKHKALLKEHIQGHKDIPSKQFVFFKCKWCSYTSTMKDYILTHIDNVHPGKTIRILRKIEKIGADDDVDDDRVSDSSDVQSRVSDESKAESNTVPRETVEVPDGNIFKTPFRCPKCTFSTNLRLETMRHIKKHPELKPVRPCLIKSTARKSTSRRDSQDQDSAMKRKKSSLIQDMPGKLQNPFKHLQKVPDACGSTTELDTKPASEYYSLGEDALHSVLSACFIHIEDDFKFQCRICQHKIAKKFVLHRHILDHLKIVFFRCKYCSEGEIERTLLLGHIQKEHSFKPLQYITVSKSELDSLFKERIFSLNFNDTVSLGNSRKETMAPTVLGLKIKRVKEYNEIDSDNENEVQVDDVTTMKKQWANKCDKCRYIARSKSIMAAHILSHDDAQKHFLCSVCDYRGKRIDVIKHIYKSNHPMAAKTVDILETASTQPIVNETKSMTSERESSQESNEYMDSSEISTDTVNHSETKASYIYIWKCKICGERKNSKGSMYGHLRKTCKQSHYRCSLCKFWSASKADITKHGLKRHSGKKVAAQLLPQISKMLEVKIRKKQQSAAFEDDGEESEEEKSKPDADNKLELPYQPTDGLLCQLCKLSVYETPMKLQYHINTVHRGCMIHCQDCPYKTPLVKHMMNHCRNVHLQAEAKYSSKPYTSDNKAGRDEETTMPISKKHKTEIEGDVKMKSETSSVCESIAEKGDKESFPCPKCGDTLSCMASLRVHLFGHFNYKRYICPYCMKTGFKSTTILKHVQIWHPNRQPKYKFVINEDIESKTKKLLDKTKKVVEIQKLPKASDRPTKLNKYAVVGEGVRRHQDVFYCDICGKEFKRASNVRRHIQDVHIALKKKHVLAEDSMTQSPKSKKQKLNTGPDTLTSPKSGQMKRGTPTPQKSSQSVAEDGRKFPFRYKIKLNSRGKKTFCCSVCSLTSNNVTSLNSHFVNAHLLGGKFKCFYCDATCTQRSNVYRHVSKKHSGKPLKAISIMTNESYTKNIGKVVDKSLNTERERSSSDSDGEDVTSVSSYEGTSNLTKTRKYMNTVTKFCCHLCDFEAQSEYVFGIHLAVHTKFQNAAVEIKTEMNFHCGYCSFIGKDRDALAIHITVHMCEPRFQCVQCGFQGFHKAKLLSHTKAVHDADNVLDRMSKVLIYGDTKLIDLQPIVRINQTKTVSRKKKYKRIAVISESDSSDNELNSGGTRSSAKAIHNKKEEIKNTPTRSKLNLISNVGSEVKEELEVKVNDNKKIENEDMNNASVNKEFTDTQPFDTTSFDAQSDEDAFDNISEFSDDDDDGNKTQPYAEDHTDQMETDIMRAESDTHATTDFETKSTSDNGSTSLNVCQGTSDNELISMQDKESSEQFDRGKIRNMMLRRKSLSDISEDNDEAEQNSAVDNDNSEGNLDEETMKVIETSNNSSSTTNSSQDPDEKKKEVINEENDSGSLMCNDKNVEHEMVEANEELQSQERSQDRNSEETENDSDSQKCNNLNKTEDEIVETNEELENQEDSQERNMKETENDSDIQDNDKNVEHEMVEANEELEIQEGSKERNTEQTENDSDSQKDYDKNVEGEIVEANEELEIQEDSQERNTEETKNDPEIGNTENCIGDLENDYHEKEIFNTDSSNEDSEKIVEGDSHNEKFENRDKDNENIESENVQENEMEFIENEMDNNRPKCVEKAEENYDTNGSENVIKMEGKHSAKKDDNEVEESNYDEQNLCEENIRYENNLLDGTISIDDKNKDDVPETTKTNEDASMEEEEEQRKIEDMDVDDLINFIDQTVKENSQSTHDSSDNMDID